MKARNPFYDGPVYGVIQTMKARGNQPGIIAQWIALAHQWALDHRGPESEAIRAWLPHFQPRPFYTASELAPMFPALIAALGLSERPPRYSALRLANELDFGKLPCVKNVDGTAFFRKPDAREDVARFYIVERIHYWRDRELTQEQFERAYHGTD